VRNFAFVIALFTGLSSAGLSSMCSKSAAEYFSGKNVFSNQFVPLVFVCLIIFVAVASAAT
jgi:hypothetical protein